jgi:lysophospholipase L1-like esterase
MPVQRRRWVRLLLGLIGFLVLAEGAARIYVYGFRSPLEGYDFAAGTLALRPGRYGSYPNVIDINSQGFLGAEFEPSKPASTLRIVSLGDSCTFGGGTPSGHYPGKLAERVESRGDVRLQVINASIDGMNSSMILRRLRARVIPLAPDLVTVYAGWNDLMKFNPEGVSPQPGRSLPFRYLDDLWSVRALRKAAYYYARPLLSEPTIGSESRSGRFSSYRSAVFEANLRDIVAEVRKIGGETLLMTLPSVVRADLSAKALIREQVQFPYFAGGSALGDYVDLIDAYNRSIRRVAISEGAMLLDLARSVEERSDRDHLFYDAMHSNPAGHAWIAQLIDEFLAERGFYTQDPSA